ncbi:DUF4065 domain-containing protein [bacterium]|nr:DUF4065 domain-containing protein [bacterium]
MALHFCRAPGVPRTKLNKLLWYADFLAFRQNTTSISGARYAHLPHGPAPDDCDTLFAWLSGPEGALRLEEVSSGTLDWEVLVANESPDHGQNSNSELALLAQVAERFKDATARALRDLSHKEPGYEQTRDGEIISYEFAERMQVVIP